METILLPAWFAELTNKRIRRGSFYEFLSERPRTAGPLPIAFQRHPETI
jgi:hypothetical protein